ncbi:amidohydrolase family protein [Alteromonas sediminis]|nr:amidohydrolase family protein [Alteromonas sediminis]
MQEPNQLNNVDIYIEDGVIISIQPTTTSQQYQATTTYDATGMYAIPGLWDSHVHLMAFDASQKENIENTQFTDIEAQAIANLEQMLSAGITSVVDMGMDASLIPTAKKLRKRPDLPHLTFSGPLITGPKSPWSKPIETHLANADDAKTIVESLHLQGVDFLKVYDGISESLLFEVARHAKRLNLNIAGHIPFKVTTKNAIKNGIRSIQHTYLQLVKDCTDLGNEASLAPLSAWMKDGYGGRWQVSSEIYRGRDKTKCTNLYRELSSNDVYLVATPQLDLPLYMVAEEWALETMSAKLKQGCSVTLMQQSKVNQSIIASRTADLVEHYRELIDAGMKLVAGSDAPNDCMGFGRSLVSTLELFVSLGLSPFEALQTATLNAADMAGAADQGSISVGKKADIVLLSNNPMADIRALRDVHAVMLNGAWKL